MMIIKKSSVHTHTHMHLYMIFLNISFTYYEQKQTTRFKESETVILDFRRLRSGQVWEQQSQEKHWYRGREKGGAGWICWEGDRILCAEHILPC